MNSCTTLILAAGQGTRMKSSEIKVLHVVYGASILEHLIHTLQKVVRGSIGCVIGHQAERVHSILDSVVGKISTIFQEQQLGTGHAVMCSRKFLLEQGTRVLVVPGDCPLVSVGTLERLLAREEEEEVCLVAARLEEPGGYGRVLLDEKGKPQRIVEYKDADTVTRGLNLVNSSIYLFDLPFLLGSLEQLTTENIQREYYLTDVIALAAARGTAGLFLLEDEREMLGVNTRDDLTRVAACLHDRIIDEHLSAGVTILDPKTTHIEIEVKIGQDSVIYPGCYLYRGARIGRNCILGPNSVIDGEVSNDSLVNWRGQR